jgi:hypothetical protein
VPKEKKDIKDIEIIVALLASVADETLAYIIQDIDYLMGQENLPEVQREHLLTWLTYIEEEVYLRSEREKKEEVKTQKEEAKEVVESIIPIPKDFSKLN